MWSQTLSQEALNPPFVSVSLLLTVAPDSSERQTESTLQSSGSDTSRSVSHDLGIVDFQNVEEVDC